MKPVRLASQMCLALTVAGSLALADGPATRPARPNFERQNIIQALRAVGARAPNIRYTPQEYSQMLEFLKEYSPARYLVLQNPHIGENTDIRGDLIRKWRNYNFVHENFPAVAEVYLKRIQTEDDLFALILQARSDTASSENEYRELIRAKITTLVQLGYDEQNIRIAKLDQLLKEEKSNLTVAEGKEEITINQRTQAIMNRIHRYSAGTTQPTSPMESDHNVAGAITDEDPNASPQGAAGESVGGNVKMTGATQVDPVQPGGDYMKSPAK